MFLGLLWNCSQEWSTAIDTHRLSRKDRKRGETIVSYSQEAKDWMKAEAEAGRKAKKEWTCWWMSPVENLVRKRK